MRTEPQVRTEYHTDVGVITECHKIFNLTPVFADDAWPGTNFSSRGRENTNPSRISAESVSSFWSSTDVLLHCTFISIAHHRSIDGFAGRLSLGFI